MALRSLWASCFACFGKFLHHEELVAYVVCRIGFFTFSLFVYKTINETAMFYPCDGLFL